MGSHAPPNSKRSKLLLSNNGRITGFCSVKAQVWRIALAFCFNPPLLQLSSLQPATAPSSLSVPPWVSYSACSAYAPGSDVISLVTQSQNIKLSRDVF